MTYARVYWTLLPRFATMTVFLPLPARLRTSGPGAPEFQCCALLLPVNRMARP
jgi:hypothetical protein